MNPFTMDYKSTDNSVIPFDVYMYIDSFCQIENSPSDPKLGGILYALFYFTVLVKIINILLHHHSYSVCKEASASLVESLSKWNA